MTNDDFPLSNDDVLYWSDHYTQRTMNEDRLSSERTNIFIVSNSFLLAGFVLAISADNGESIPALLGALGVFLSGLQLPLMYYNFRVLGVWERRRNILLEHESLQHIRSRQLLPLQVASGLSETYASVRWIHSLKVDPHNIARYWFPFGFLMMWTALLLLGFQGVIGRLGQFIF